MHVHTKSKEKIVQEAKMKFLTFAHFLVPTTHQTLDAQLKENLTMIVINICKILFTRCYSYFP